MKQALLFLSLYICALPSFTQINGKVLDAITKKPLSGAHIIADNELAITDDKGNFTLQKSTKQINTTYLGYTPDTLEIAGDEGMLMVYLKPSSREIEQIIITGNLNEFPIMQMPSAIGYIKNLEKQNLNILSWVENLNMIPGTFVHTGTLSTNRITIRGIGSRTPYGTNRIKAYYNEIPLTNGDGSTEIEDIHASSINTIEILKGSKSALYGSGLGGVIVLNKPAYPEGVHGFVRIGAASFQSYTYEGEIQFRKKGFYIGGSYAHSQSDGWRENSRYTRDNFAFNAGFKRANNKLDVTLLAIKTRTEIPSSINAEMFENNPENAADNWLEVNGYEDYSKLIAGLLYRHTFNKYLSNATNVFFKYYDGYESRPFNILEDESMGWGLRNITALQLSKVKIQLGVETLLENYSLRIYETQSGKKGDLQREFAEERIPITLFLNGQYRFQNKAVIEAGISFNTLYYRLIDEFAGDNDLSGDYRYDWVVSPFIGFNISAGIGFNVYGSVSHGFSAPTVEETLLPEGAVNPDLKPETGINAEIGVRFNSKNERLFIDACVYGLWVQDLLVTKRETEEIFYGINAGKTRHYGFEITSAIHANNPESDFPVTLNVNYTLLSAKFNNFTDDVTDYAGNSLPGIPRQNLWLAVNIASRFGFSVLTQLQFTGQQYLNDANTGSYGPYYILNLKAKYSKILGKVKADVEFAIGNLLNQLHASMILINAPSFGGSLPRYYYPGMPRNYSVSLKFGI